MLNDLRSADVRDVGPELPVVSSLVFDVAVRDPLTYGVVAAVLALVALAACIIPARKASQVDPMIALRYD
jgi:putative ABC transport system permease protein